MKLINKTILYYLLLSFPLLLISGLISFFIIQNEVHNETDESIWKEKIIAEKIIQSLKEPQSVYLSLDSLSTITLSNTSRSDYFFSDTLIFDKIENEKINYRVLYNYYKVKNSNYLIKIMKSTLENEDLSESLLFTLLLIIVFLLISFLFINLIFSKILWKPFYKTLEKLNKYDVKQSSVTNFKTSTTTEFKCLNKALTSMINKIFSDYNQLKEFTENASHEIQTPLSVIKSKLDILMQSENLKENDMLQIQLIDDSVNKLSSLNKALLLLTKIGNNQFKAIEEINIRSVLEKQLLNVKDLIEEKNITLNTNFNNEIILKMNIVLCDILFANVLQNAIRHNFENGIINISITDKKFTIENTGSVLNIKPFELFERFKKNDAANDSLGLGLAIVKGIADTYSFEIDFIYEDEKYIFLLLFV